MTPLVHVQFVLLSVSAMVIGGGYRMISDSAEEISILACREKTPAISNKVDSSLERERLTN